MDLSHPRKAYERADTDDDKDQDAIEMVSIRDQNGVRYDYTELGQHVHSYHDINPDIDRVALLPQPTSRAKLFSGWRTGAYSASCLALVSLATSRWSNKGCNIEYCHSLGTQHG